jgi:hypothetical protein
MADLKVPLALVFAMSAQLIGGVWWVSGQAHKIIHLQEEVSSLQESLSVIAMDTDLLVVFAEYTENKWANGYDEDPSYTRIFGIKPSRE